MKISTSLAIFGSAAAFLATAHSQTYFADWTTATKSTDGVTASAAGTLGATNTPYSVTWVANAGADISTAHPALGQSGATPDAFDASWMQPGGAPEWVGTVVRPNNTAGAYVEMKIDFTSPISNLRMLINEIDFSYMVFTSINGSTPNSSTLGFYSGTSKSEDAALVSSTVSGVGGMMLYDNDVSDFGTTGTTSNSASGTLLVNGGNAVTSMTVRYYDNPNFTPSNAAGSAGDGHHWTFATVVPEPGAAALGVLGLGGLLLRRRRAA